MKVRFSDIDEFVRELDKDADLVERRIVRVTRRFTPSSHLPSVRVVELVATAKVNGDVYALERYIGELGWHGEPDEKTKQSLTDQQLRLEGLLGGTESGGAFDIRAGVLEP